MSKEVKDFIEMMERNNSSPLMGAMPEAKSWHETLINSPEYQALKASVERGDENGVDKR